MSVSALNGAFAMTLLLMTCGMTSCELLKNGGFDNGMDPWHCWGFSCELLGSADSHQGSHAIRSHGRTKYYQGPSQEMTTVPGKLYQAQSWIKFLNDTTGSLGQLIELEVAFNFPDDSHDYVNVAMRPLVTVADGWFLLQGDFQAPPKAVKSTTFYYQGPVAGVDFAVDQASVAEVTSDSNWRKETDDVINRVRKSNINIVVTSPANIDKSAVKLRVVQTKKGFPFGATVDSWKYVNSSQQKYRDFIHTHFNWAVPGNALKWRQFDWHQPHEGPGDKLYARAQSTIDGLRKAGLKVRGHNMVWSVEQFIPEKIKQLSGQQLRDAVKNHIQWTMNVTKGTLEHWDVNNENLHGQWFQERLHDRDYDLELFRMMHQADPVPKLFLNDYNVVAQGAATSAYLAQGQRFKNANVHMSGMGVQCHFFKDQEPNPSQIKRHLDTLATVGVPLWATELDVQSADENTRADYIEKALRALYGHPAIEGIMFWSYGGSSPSSLQALVVDGSMTLTAAGRRVLDLLENQWMTDETHVLSQSGDHFTVRGFHGDYEMQVIYQGHQQSSLNFTLGKDDETVNVNVHGHT
ncbi:uncharacterized protein [Littorina saxatilis]|uniref:GH10 domain-containing protein n=1 Tax=Littorina saxatilis TaxID=31220 RepID=A0AAN9BEZ7_9CAEN